MWPALLVALGLTGSAAFVSAFDLTILHDNDVHSRFLEYDSFGGRCSEEQSNKRQCFGGAARRAALVKQIKQNTSNVVYLSAGDQFQGTLWYSLLRWPPIAQVMNYIGYTAMAFGNHEFDSGLEGLVPFVQNLTFPIVSTNIDATGTPLNGLFQKVLVHTVNGERIGILGYTTPETVLLSKTGDLDFKPEIETLQEAIQTLEASGVNKIIAVGHSGISVDRQLCKSVRGLDVAVGGHTNTFLYTGDPPSSEQPEGKYPEVFEDTGSPCLVVQDYAFGKYLGFLQVTFDTSGRLTKWQGNPILLNGSYPQDQELLNRLKPFENQLEKYRREVVAFSAVGLDGSRLSCRLRECNLGNLLADATVLYYLTRKPDRPNASTEKVQNSWSPVSIGFFNGGGVRDFESKPNYNLTMEDLYTVMPFGNTMELIEISGKTLRALFEYAVEDYHKEDAHGKFLQVSGIRVVYDLRQPNGRRVVSLDARCANCPIPRFEPVKSDKTYRAVTTSYLTEGGDGYSMIRDNLIVQDHLEVLDIDIVVEYLKRIQPIFIGNEGRITFLGETTDASSFGCKNNGGAHQCSICFIYALFYILFVSLPLSVFMK